MGNAALAIDVNNHPLPGIERAVVMVPRKIIRERIMSELKKQGLTQILCTEDSHKALTETKLHKHSMLVVDLTMGIDESIKILEASKSKYKADTRAVYLLGEDLDQNVIGLASDYNAIRVRAGIINGSQIKKDICDICEYERLTLKIRQALHEVALLREKNLHNQAAKILSNLRESQKNNPKIAVEYTETLIELGDLDEAKKILQEILAEHPSQVRALTLFARIEMKKGNYEDAQNILEKASVFNSRNVDRLIDLGHCLLNQDKVSKAKKIFDEALSINMNSVKASIGRGQCALLEGDISMAMDFLYDSSDLEIVAAFNNAAVICIRNRRMPEGLELYQTAMAQVNTTPTIMSRVVFNLGLGYLKSKNIKSAKIAFEKALNLDPSFTKASHNIEALNKMSLKPVSTEQADADSAAMDEGYSVLDLGKDSENSVNESIDPSNIDLNLSDKLFESISMKDI